MCHFNEDLVCYFSIFPKVEADFSQSVNSSLFRGVQKFLQEKMLLCGV